MSATTNQAARSPMNEWTSYLVFFALAALAWAGPAGSSRLLSETDWHADAEPGKLFAAYQHLFDPETLHAEIIEFESGGVVYGGWVRLSG